MLQFNKLNQAVEEALSRTSFAQLIKHTNMRAAFYPLAQRDLGIVATRLCLDLSALLSLDPEIIAAEILAQLPRQISAVLAFQDGYLNLVALPQDGDWVSLATLDPIEASEVVQLVIPTPYPGLEGISYLRVLASVLVQLSALRAHGYKASLVSAGFGALIAADQPHDIHSCIAVWQRVLAANLDSREQSIEALISSLDQSAAARSFLWVFPLHLSTSALDRLTARGAPSARLYSSIKFLEANWLFGFDQAQEFELLASLNSAHWLNLIFLLAGNTQASDFDLRLCRAESRLNPGWFIRATLQRLSRLAASTIPGSLGAPLAGLLEQFLLGTYWRAAGEHALVREYIGALERLLIQCNRDLNLGRDDSKLSPGSSPQLPIAAGTLHNVLSEIARRDLLMSHVCMEVPA